MSAQPSARAVTVKRPILNRAAGGSGLARAACPCAKAVRRGKADVTAAAAAGRPKAKARRGRVTMVRSFRGFDAVSAAASTHAKTPAALLFMGRLLMEERIG